VIGTANATELTSEVSASARLDAKRFMVSPEKGSKNATSCCVRLRN
jgi:hypothetical protein